MKAYLEQLYDLLQQKDFEAVLGVSGIFLRVENPVLYVIVVQSVEEENVEHQAAVRTFAEQLQQELPEYCCTQLICLYLTIGDTPHTPHPLQVTDRLTNLHHIAWHFNPQSGILTVAEDSPKKLLGIEKLLHMAAKGEQLPKDTLYTDIEMENQTQRPIVSFAIFAICVLVLAYGLLFGKHMDILDAFSVSRQRVIQYGEYYRLLSCMFVHSGISHLLANSVYLLYFGTRAEFILGWKRFLVLYFVSGLCGSLCSILFGGYPSVGASGAVCGLIGAMLVVTRAKGAAYTGMNYATMLLLSFAVLAMGFLDIGVDNWAHLGGFLSGVLMIFFMLRPKTQQ